MGDYNIMLRPYEYQRTDSIFSCSDEELVNLDVDTLSEADRARIELLASKLNQPSSNKTSSIFSCSNEDLANLRLDTLDLDTVNKFLIADKAIRASAASDSYICFDKPFYNYVMYAKLLYPQMYGSRLENRLRFDMGLSRSSKGDVCNKYGANFEIKASYTSVSGVYNFLQIRQYEKDIDGYCLLTVDDSTYKSNLFFLTPDQMKYEVSIIGSPCHISKAKARGNRAIEERVTVDAYALRRWKQSYKVEDLECMKSILQTIKA